MATKWVELVTGSIEQKKRYRRYRARTKQLPENYRSAVEALERYLMYFGPSGDSELLVSMVGDLGDLFEQSAADGTSVRAIVGDDPVQFAEEFLRTYPGASWVSRERERLARSIDRACGDDSGSGGSLR